MNTETHTTDLTCSCKRQRLLVLEGKEQGETATALFRGNAGHGALEALHVAFDPEQWRESATVEACVQRGIRIAVGKSQDENRPITAAVEKGMDSIRDELIALIGHYAERFADYFAQCQMVGVEVPVRCPIEVDGIVEDFASHLDLLFIGPDWWNEGSDFMLRVWDWKFKAEAPSPEYVSRQLQLAGYAHAVRHGKFHKDEQWHEIQCGSVSVAIVDMMRCKPYGTSKKDGDGGYVYRKGDDRDLNRIVHSRVIDERGMALWQEDFCEHVRMKRLGIWPKSPDPISCSNCDVRAYCEGYGQ